jgi:hypothetical protein
VTSQPESDTSSAGESGKAGGGGVDEAEVIVGEIPMEDDPSTLQWTARCSDPSHDLLGHFESRDEAEGCGNQHLKDEHREG